MQTDLLQQLSELNDNTRPLYKIKELLASGISNNRLLAEQLLKAEGYSPLQQKLILQFLGAKRGFLQRLVIEEFDELTAMMSGIGIFCKTGTELKAADDSVAKCLKKQWEEGDFYSLGTAVWEEIYARANDLHVYAVLLLDHLPFLLINDLVELKHSSVAINQDISAIDWVLLPEIPEGLFMPEPLEVQLQCSVHGQLFCADSFTVQIPTKDYSLDLLYESLGDAGWQLSLGYQRSGESYQTYLEQAIPRSEQALQDGEAEKNAISEALTAFMQHF